MITLSMTERQAAAVLARLVSAPVPNGLDLDRPKHYSDVQEATTALAVELERAAHKATGKPDAGKPAMGETPRHRGRPSNASKAAKGAAKVASGPHDHVFEFSRCKVCGEPEPQDCAHGYHLYEGGACKRCGKAEAAK